MNQMQNAEQLARIKYQFFFFGSPSRPSSVWWFSPSIISWNRNHKDKDLVEESATGGAATLNGLALDADTALIF